MVALGNPREPRVTEDQQGNTRRGIPRLAVLAGLLVLALAGALLLGDRLTLEALADRREELTGFRDSHFGLTVAGFMAVYAGLVTLSLPGATVMTLTGGLLFGVFPGTFINVGAAGTGAVALFLLARWGAGNTAERLAAAGPAASRLMAGLKKNEWSVLFLMRLIPLVPFFLANITAATLGVPLHRFVISTFLGILPGAWVYTSVGAGLGDVFAAGGQPDLGAIFRPGVLIPLLALAALAALPMLVRSRQKGDAA